MKRVTRSLFFLIILISNTVFAQRDYSWQDDYTNVTNWWQYITPVSKYMGPFSLPVPSVYEGRIEENSELSAGYSYYEHTKGDAPTHACYTRLYLPLVAGRIAVEISLVPYESYSYSDEMADYLHAYETSGGGTGDVYINTYVQVLHEKNIRPDITLRYGIKTASGEDFDNARFTDSPAYYFDLSLGKTLLEDDKRNWRVFGNGGFYCWQYEDGEKLEDNMMQDDAYLFGIGTSYTYKDWKIKGDFSGYSGWKEDDKPLMLRFEGDAPLGKNFKLRFLYERGLRDYPYNGFHARLVYQFGSIW